jgi:hypothetical protein
MRGQRLPRRTNNGHIEIIGIKFIETIVNFITENWDIIELLWIYFTWFKICANKEYLIFLSIPVTLISSSSSIFGFVILLSKVNPVDNSISSSVNGQIVELSNRGATRDEICIR